MMDRDIHKWAARFVRNQGRTVSHARVNAVHDAVVTVLGTGIFGAERADVIYTQAYAAYGDTLAQLCRDRGLGRHPHKRGANDN